MENFYELNQDKFVSAFDTFRSAVVDYLSNQSNPEDANDISNEAANNFEKILPELPYIGGDAHPGTRFMVEFGQWISLYQAMIKKGYTALEIGKMIYLICEDQHKTIPPDEVEKQKALTYNKDYIHMMKLWTETTSPYEYDWKANFVEGDGVEFDYGLDYTSCPVLELFKAYNAKELAPFICLLDFPEARHLDSGFFRTKTLAKGDDVCNFRYKKGKEVVQSWETEINSILKSAKP